MNSKIQGNIGIGQAIAHYTSKGNIVCIPLTDSQKYDLVVDIDGILARVQVKTTMYKEGEVYQVALRTSGGNSSRNSVSLFDNKASDILFVWCGNNDIYEIPCEEITNINSINLGSKYSLYKVQ